jgi:YggT family protein
VNSFVAGFDTVYAVLRWTLFIAVVVIAIVCLIDWLVRTRRINPFNPIARYMRSTVDPLMAPVERKIVRAGGLPTAAPWWTLVFAVVGSIVLLWFLGFVRSQLTMLAGAGMQGSSGILMLLIQWTFGILYLSILVRVVSSWVRVSPYSPWVRWAFHLSEPILRPLRQIVPTLGPIDITPIVAYVLLRILEAVILSAFTVR